MSYILNVIASSLSNIRLLSHILFKHFFAIQQRNACQRKCTKGNEPCGGSLPLEFLFPLHTPRGGVAADRGKFCLFKKAIGQHDRLFEYGV